MPKLSYAATASYEIAGAPLNEAREIWLVCHGYGQLARHFIRRFDVLPADCAVVAAQGLSRFYLDHHTGTYEQVGASWLTRDEREMDMANMLAYLSALWSEVSALASPGATWKVMGFSQGVSAVLRWVAHCQIPVQAYSLWAGVAPAELAAADLPQAPATLVVGRQDTLLREDRILADIVLFQALFAHLQVHWFDGGHEVPRAVLAEVLIR